MSVARDEEKDPLDVEGALAQLNRALAGQGRSALQYALAQASFIGFELYALSETVGSFAQAELDDFRRLVAKVAALGGEPTTEIEPVRLYPDPEEELDWLIESESSTVEALQDTIRYTGHTGDSEALEHRLEHMIMRKQEQLDVLARARRRRA